MNEIKWIAYFQNKKDFNTVIKWPENIHFSEIDNEQQTLVITGSDIAEELMDMFTWLHFKVTINRVENTN